jgi:hypothetical protein
MTFAPEPVPPAPAPGVAASAPASIAPPARGRRRWVVPTLLIAGVVALLLSFIPAVASSGADDYPVIAVPGVRSIELGTGHSYTLYFDYRDAQSQERTPPAVRVTGPTGDEEPLIPVTDGSTYETMGGRQGRAFASLRPAVAGIYRFEVGAAPGSDTGETTFVAVGGPDDNLAIAAFAALALLGVALIVAGIVVFTVHAVRGRRPPAESSTLQSATPGPAWEAPDPSARAPD